jgi:hypothetical protein
MLEWLSPVILNIAGNPFFPVGALALIMQLWACDISSGGTLHF